MQPRDPAGDGPTPAPSTRGRDRHPRRVLIAPAGARAATEAPLPQITSSLRVTLSDGVELEVKLAGRGPLVDGELPARPVIAEFSPYRPGCCAEYGGPDYNYLQIHIRGTGDSDGTFDAFGAPHPG